MPQWERPTLVQHSSAIFWDQSRHLILIIYLHRGQHTSITNRIRYNHRNHYVFQSYEPTQYICNRIDFVREPLRRPI